MFSESMYCENVHLYELNVSLGKKRYTAVCCAKKISVLHMVPKFLN